jgi:DNA mismatch repair protein MutS
LFATHYHELTDLADSLPGVVNAHVAAREWKDDIIFLRKILPGRSDRSYGIQVARLAGLPDRVIARAREILGGLERDELSRGGRPTLSGAAGDPKSSQLGLFARPADEIGTASAAALRGLPPRPEDDIARRLRATDVDEITPRRALELLAELKELAEGR